jgi:macrolide-specific efflux system membrane fusion protein
VAGVAVIGLVTAGVWWFGIRDASASQAATQTTRTVAASLTTLQKSVSGTGTITPSVQEDVSFAVSGTVTAVDVATGQTVTAGQTLATVDTLQLNADLLSAQATLASAKAKLSDATDSSDGSTSAKAQVAAAQAQVDVAQSQADAAQTAMAGATLTAPVAGLLTEVNLEVGDAVTGSSTGNGGNGSDPNASSSDTSTAQFVIVGTDAWQVEVSVSDADVANVAVGDQAEVTPDGATDPVFGTIASIGLLSTSTQGVAAYPVTVDITPGQDGLHDGVSADVDLVYERRTDVLTIPSLAVTTTDGRSTVTKVAADGTQSTVDVTVGETSGNLTEITAGLVEGDEVVLAVFTPGGNRSGQNGNEGPQLSGPGYGGFQGGPPEGFTGQQNFQGGRNNG